MTVQFGNAFIITTLEWPAFKNVVSSKAMAMQYDDDGTQYTVYAIDNPIVYITYLRKGPVPDSPGWNQATNDANELDFETNYKSICNKPLDMQTTISGSMTGSGLIGFYGAYVGTAATSLVAARATTYVEQLTAQRRSFSSNNAADNASGSGTRQIRLTYYDNSMMGPYTEDLYLSGTTVVNTVNTNIRFIEKIESTLTGSNGGNVGTINMFVTSSGAGGTMAQVAAGDSKTYWGHHYVRPNSMFYLTRLFLNSTTVAGAAAIRVLNPFIVNSFENQIGTFFRIAATSQQGAPYDFGDTIQVPGPAKVSLWIKPDAVTASTFYLNFGWEEY